ncbi:putative transposable element [Trichonephila clavipes]|nr:putative transposable element [Trichonephila clavipes]
MASEKMKTRYDARATRHDFHEGDSVVMESETCRKGLSLKLQTNWEGPFTVLKRPNDVVVRIQKSLYPKPKNNHDVRELWFQQDGATCHTARATIDLLKDTFGDRLISRFGPVNWPPRSCNLTPLDYFLRGYVKSLVYADKPQTLEHLEDNIRRVIADIRPEMLEKVIENWTSRLDNIRASRGSHMPEIIFKICHKIIFRIKKCMSIE